MILKVALFISRPRPIVLKFYLAIMLSIIAQISYSLYSIILPEVISDCFIRVFKINLHKFHLILVTFCSIEILINVNYVHDFYCGSILAWPFSKEAQAAVLFTFLKISLPKQLINSLFLAALKFLSNIIYTVVNYSMKYYKTI